MTTAADARSWRVMLAASGPATSEAARHLKTQGYTFDMKWDGVRCLIVKDDNGVALLNRKGEDFAYRYPEIVSAVQAQYPTRMVLDGEVVIFDGDGRPAFGLTGQRALGPARVKDIARMAALRPATFVAFDCLAASSEGSDLRPQPQSRRLEALDRLIPANTERIVKSIRMDDGVAMLSAVKRLGIEGIIAKRLAAPYKAGRRSDWIKMKPTKRVTCLVTGWEPGEGWRADTFGALNLGVLSDQGETVNVGKVGSGFSVADLATLDPFVKAGAELLVEVEYLERQPGTGVLRFPVFIGPRFDVERSAASMSQFA